jgi:hypothetical protein
MRADEPQASELDEACRARDASPSAESRRDRAAAVLVFLVASIAALLCQRGLVTSADGSSYALVRALATRASPRIEPQVVYTGGIDYALHEGRAFSDRAPATAVAALPLHALGLGLARARDWPLLADELEGPGIWPQPDQWPLRDAAIAGALAWPAACLGATCALLYALARRARCSFPAALVAALSYGLGTIALKYGALLHTHASSAALVLGALWLALELERGGSGRALAAGLCIGLLPAAEYPTLLLVPVLLLLALRRGPRALGRARASALGCGVALPALALALYNTHAFGAPWASSYSAHASFPWARELGSSFVTPLGTGLWGLFFDPERRGLFGQSPFLVFALLGWPWLLVRDRCLAWTCLALALPYALVLAQYRSYSGGGTRDPRYLMPVLACLALPLAAWIDGPLRAARAPLSWLLAWGSLAFACASALLANYWQLRLFAGDPWDAVAALAFGPAAWLGDPPWLALARIAAPLAGVLCVLALGLALLSRAGSYARSAWVRPALGALALALACLAWPQLLVPASRAGVERPLPAAQGEAPANASEAR